MTPQELQERADALFTYISVSIKNAPEFLINDDTVSIMVLVRMLALMVGKMTLQDPVALEGRIYLTVMTQDREGETIH